MISNNNEEYEDLNDIIEAVGDGLVGMKLMLRFMELKFLLSINNATIFTIGSGGCIPVGMLSGGGSSVGSYGSPFSPYTITGTIPAPSLGSYSVPCPTTVTIELFGSGGGAGQVYERG